MKKMTVIATVLMSAALIAGIYGMNFKNMPELESHYGYFVCLGVMGVVGLGMVLYMKKNRWL
jgi:magnesium transporter